MADINSIMNWTFVNETEIPEGVHKILVEGEEAQVAYKTIRDVAIVTNKRIIIADKQGITGKKVEIYTIPFKSIIMYSSEDIEKLYEKEKGYISLPNGRLYFFTYIEKKEYRV